VFRQVVAKRGLPVNIRQITPLRARPDETFCISHFYTILSTTPPHIYNVAKDMSAEKYEYGCCDQGRRRNLPKGIIGDLIIAKLEKPPFATLFPIFQLLHESFTAFSPFFP